MLVIATENGGSSLICALQNGLKGKPRERKSKLGLRCRIPKRFREDARARKTGVLKARVRIEIWL